MEAWKILVIKAVSAAIRGPTVIITTMEANATGKKLGSKLTSIAFSPKRSVPPSSRINLDKLRLAKIANETIPALAISFQKLGLIRIM